MHSSVDVHYILDAYARSLTDIAAFSQSTESVNEYRRNGMKRNDAIWNKKQQYYQKVTVLWCKITPFRPFGIRIE